MSATKVQPNTSQGPALTALDRCDRCGAQAYIRLEHIDFGEFLFCAHDWRKNEDKLKAGAITLHDETHKLEPVPYDPITDND